MNYSTVTKPAKILNLQSLHDLNERLYLTRNSDTAYLDTKNTDSKKTDNNAERIVFNLQTSDINIQPSVRLVNCTRGSKRYNHFQSFVIEPKDKSTGIVVIMIKLDDPKAFYCNVRILPLTTLSDIALPESDSKPLTINLERSKCILKTDITITPSNTGEAMYSVHDVDVSDVSDLVTPVEMIELKRELEFQASKLIAHYFQEILSIVVNETPVNNGKPIVISDDYILTLPHNQLKEMLSANAISGCISLEVTGYNVIRGLNPDWRAASAFIGYIL
ncbi:MULTISPECIES: hypothetical protein [Chryseobacterium]|jgi:hypothetical protein|uniref:Uncharacterized protein n=1 Tax=Chryseobacterium rhizosphaerae TaxID=395937 RepID=A0AAE3YDC5_9FLAO|nr:MULTISPECIES: hypothetical protein [Chryseobacterium]MBL3550492.1 hypothetical protein [Chryseobacterium sp. KMC2]MDC8099285.1 hypothetical protein [Chryseobacterium rhizosphaerae]MDR6528747.1 hypothetical protein [Chryseobacterium rhizosphaerae]MDR6546301.1 hypothetical protein [Chryseobacterium rhizosphaerae]REC75484.1 hypothetical protein DRF57_10720 [Chryseobacterium rhizosphaerae]